MRAFSFALKTASNSYLNNWGLVQGLAGRSY